MSIITIGTPFNIDLEFKVAAFSKRLSAWAIDITVICFYYYIMLRFISPLFYKSEAISSAAELLVIVAPVLLYQLSMELFVNGQTLGKMVAGIKVIDIEGREPTWGQYFIRWILCIGNLYIYVIPYLIGSMIYRNAGQNIALMFFLMIVYLPDFLSVIISEKSQRIGDFAAGTVVIDKNYKPDINETIYLEIEDKTYKPLFPEVMRLTDRDINGIRNLINMKGASKDTEHYIVDVAQKIKLVLGVESDLHPTDFLRQLLQDYNYITAQN
jgi:uncharacterized RDD family membrane protein YckC